MHQSDAKVGAASASNRYLDRRIFLLSGALFATSTDAFVVVGILPLIVAGLGADPGAVGQMLTVYMVTFAIGSPILAVAFANWRRDLVIAASLFIFSATDIVSALAPGFITLLCLRVVAACCAATYVPFAFVTAAALSPVNRRSAGLAVATLGLVASQLIGVPISTWVGQTFGWRATYVFDACLVLLVATALGFLRAPSSQESRSLSLRDRISPLGKANVLLALLPVMFWGMGYAIIYSYCAVLLGPNVGFDRVPLLLVSSGLGGAAGSQIASHISDRFGPSVPIVGFISLSAANIAMLGWTGQSFAGAAAAMFILTLCYWGIFIPQQTRLLIMEPIQGPTVLSLSTSVIYLGMGAGAAIGAALVTYQWLAAMYLVGAGAYLAALGLFLWSLRFEVRHRSAGTVPERLESGS